MASREKAESNALGKKVEGFGIVFLEAGACEKPVIGGNSGGVEDAVLDGVTGLLIDPTDIEAISRSALQLFLDNALADKLSKNSRKRILENLTMQKTADKVEQISHELIKRNF